MVMLDENGDAGAGLTIFGAIFVDVDVDVEAPKADEDELDGRFPNPEPIGKQAPP